MVEAAEKQKDECVVYVRVTPYLKLIIRELSAVKIDNEYVRVVPEHMITKEALVRGLRMMLVEKRTLDEMEKKYASSLIKVEEEKEVKN